MSHPVYSSFNVAEQIVLMDLEVVGMYDLGRNFSSSTTDERV